MAVKKKAGEIKKAPKIGVTGRIADSPSLQYLLGISVCLFGVLLFSNFEFARSDSPPGLSDFGAETIDPLPPPPASERKPFSADGTLPVDLVEERAELASASQLPTGGEGTTPAADQLGAENVENGNIEGGDSMTTVLNVTDVELSSLIKTFSKLTRRNYIVDSTVKGKVTVHLPTAVTIEEALKIFDTVLLLKGFTTVPVQDNTWKVIPAKDAKQTTIPLIGETPSDPSDQLVTQMIRLKHTSSQEMQQLLSQFISASGVVRAVSGSNSLVVIDSAANIARLQELVTELDIPAVDQEITIIPITHAEAGDIAEKINQILGSDDQEGGARQQPVVQRPNVFTRRAQQINAAQQQQNQQQGEARATLPLKIIPDERTNSLIVVADPSLTLKVQALAEQLDSEVDRSGGRFWVYRLKHADAEELADILNNLISGATGSSSSGSSASTQGSSISRSRNRNSDSRQTTSNQLQNTSNRTFGSGANSRGALARTAGSNDGRVNLEGEVSIAPDPATNSLIVNASRTDYQRLKEVISELDIKRRQVLVEATILEVTLSDDEGMGIELQGTASLDDKGGLFGQSNFGGITNLLTNPAALTDLTIAAASTGTLTLPGGIVIPSQAVLITALSRHSNVNVLSAPTIIATDNEEAEIIVGENVPFVTGTSRDITNINSTFNQIERQDVGITLRITPQISTGDFVMLRIFVEISNVVPATRNDPNGPTTTIRTTDTSVEVKNRQMVITGGLIQDSVTDSSRGVPFIQDIPVLGEYFKRTDQNIRRTNLLVFITPRIVSDQFEAREHTKSAAEEMKGEIRTLGAEPDRSEVLNSPNMDEVVSAVSDGDDEVEFQVPTTITAPEKKRAEEAAERTLRRLRAIEPDVSSDPSNDLGPSAGDRPAEPSADDEIIDITVAPELPGDRAAAPARPMFAPSSESRTYVVLREVERSGNPGAFGLSEKNGTLGLVVPGAPGSSSAAFFQVGRRYSFEDAGYQGGFVCLGVYGSPAEAALIHPELSGGEGWQPLTPEQTLALGSRGWRRG